MSRLLLRVGGLAIVGSVVYLVVGDALLAGADYALFRTILLSGVVCMAVGVVAWAAGRATAGLIARACPRCGRRVARGRVYCEDHLKETINEYRDHQRDRGGS
ncbi:MAG TPA: hypothetical protein VFT43_09490 [Candidatus Polarisedimenticolia bacterium]|nr:hypothetical protein [Candidatus Polarisedimenticolia bacterium]